MRQVVAPRRDGRVRVGLQRAAAVLLRNSPAASETRGRGGFRAEHACAHARAWCRLSDCVVSSGETEEREAG